MVQAVPSRAPVVVLAVSGSIAAYKAVEVARLLLKTGARVVPIMTHSAQRFVGAATLAGICGEPVRSEMFSPDGAGEAHVALAACADVIALVPATAELLAGLAHGHAGDLVRATVLCASSPVLAAPAMHPRMWQHAATQRNVALLQEAGQVQFLGPVEGEVASGEVGMGRMAEPQEIAAAILQQCGPTDLRGSRVVVTAGPTLEAIDPARYLGNRSSGKMGFAIAQRAAARGAEVTLIAGPVNLQTPPGVIRVNVRSAADMRSALHDALGAGLDRADALVMAAAVADYRAQSVAAQKLKRDDAELLLRLVPNADLIAEIGAQRQHERPFLVGFALETLAGDALVEAARGKLKRKQLDLVVANRADDAFERDDNLAILVTADEAESMPRMSKVKLADAILDRLAKALATISEGNS